MEQQPPSPQTPVSPRSFPATSRSPRAHSLFLDLSKMQPFEQPTPPSNTLLLTNLNSTTIFRPDNLQTIRDLVAKIAPIHAWAPLKSFRRIVVSFFDAEAAIRVRSVWDGEAILGERCRVYFGSPTPTDNRDTRLALPDAGKLFFISPPPSPPHGWEIRTEDAPNKMVHAEDLADALAKLRHDSSATTGQSPVSPTDSTGPACERAFGSRQRSRSSTLIFQPEPVETKEGMGPELPCVTVDDMTDEPDVESDVVMGLGGRPIMAHTSRPPVELMHET